MRLALLFPFYRKGNKEFVEKYKATELVSGKANIQISIFLVPKYFTVFLSKSN